MNYEHGDTIDFSGGQLTATYKDSSGNTLEDTLNIASEIATGEITVDKTKADVDNKKVTFTYKSLTTDMTLTVTDPVSSISITKQPTNVTYDDGDTISLAGGEITPVTKSGKTLTPISADDSKVTASSTTASISSIPVSDRWVIAGGNGLTAGNQKITLTYEGKTADLNIVVNDTVSGVSITTQPTAQNKYGTSAGALNYSGLVATITTSGGGSFTVGASSLAIDTSGYNPTKLAKQSLPVKYGTINSTNTVDIQLVNYITGITTAFTKTEFDYDTSLDDVISNGKYVEVYADGSSSSPKTITAGMVTGYVQKPAGSLFNVNHKYNETLTIKLDSSSNVFDKLPATQVITINDVIKDISVLYKPSKVTYKYGEAFSATGGQININYISGAQSNISMEASGVTLTEQDGSTINMSPSASSFVSKTATKTIKVSYTSNGKIFDTSFDVYIKDEAASISISKNPKTIFNHGDTFDESAGELKIVYKSGNSEVINLNQAVVTESDGSEVDMEPKYSKYTNNNLVKNLLVTYRGKTTNYDITLQNPIDSITIENTPKQSYKLNEATTGVGGTIKVTRKAGNTESINIDDSMVSGLDTTVAGTGKTATITYTDEFGNLKTTTYTYDVIDNVTSIDIVAPSKNVYNHGEALALDGTITVHYASGTTNNVTMTSSMIKEGSGAVDMSPTSYDDDTQKVNKKLTIEYSEGGVTKSIDYPITIINDVKSITIKTLPQTEYKVNETLDITTGELLVTRAVGTEIVTMSSPKVTVSGFDNTQESKDLKLTVDYTENGITKTTDYLVNVTDNVQSISLKTMPPTNYKYGEPLNVTGGQIEVVKDSGVQTINITNDMIKELDGSEFDSTKLGTRKLQISYGGKTLEYEITVEDYVTGIILTPPTKLVYECGEELDLTGGKIEKVMASGTKIDVALSDSSVSISGYDKTKAGSQTINVIYEGITKQFGVTVEDNVQSVTLIGTPKTEYKYGESLDVAGLQLEVTSSSGNKQYVTVTPSMVTGFNSNQLGEQILIITYKGKTVQYKVNVKDYVKDIEIVEPTKLVYKLNETIDLNGGTVRAVMASGTATSPVAMTSAMITGFDSTSIGAKTLTVSYQGYTKTFGITVQDLTNSMVIKTLPNKVKYLYGQKLDLTGGTIEITKESGETEIISMTSSMVTGYNSNKLGTQTLTVTYDGLSQTFPVTVEDYELNSLFITPPTKRNYEYGESLDLTGGKVTTKMASGAIKESTNMTASMISGFDNTKVGSQKITVTYDGKSNSFTISVKDLIKGISMNTQPNKTNYDFGANLDVSGATITVVKSSGITVIPVTSNMISEYNPKNAGTQVIKVSYGGFTTNFIVNVLPKKNSTKDSNTKDNTNINRHHNKTNNNNNEEANIPNQEETKDNQITNDNVQENQNTKPKENTKEEDNKEVPKNNTKDDKKQEDKDIERNKGINKKSIAAIIAAIALGILILIIVFKRNVRILIEEDGEFVLGGLDKVSKNNLKLDIDQYLDKDTYDNKVKVVFNDSISKKLDGKIIEINYKNRVFKYKIHYADKPFEINLDNSVINRIEVIK